MEPDRKHINSNPELVDWRVEGTIGPQDGLEFCRGWLLSLQAGDGHRTCIVEPLDALARSGLRLRLPANQRVQIGSMIGSAALLHRGWWRLAVRLRGVGDAGTIPKLDAAYLLQRSNAGTWAVDSQLMRESTLSEEWSDLETPFEFFRPSTPQPRFEQLWSKLKVIAGIDQQPSPEPLLLALQFSRRGVIEIQSCKLEPLNSAPADRNRLANYELLQEVQPTEELALGLGLHPEAAALSPRSGAVPIEEGEIVALLAGRLVGWVRPGPALVNGSVQVDGSPIGAIAETPLNGAEIALLGQHRDGGFAIKLPATLINGKVSRVGLFDEVVERPVKGSDVSLMLRDGLHVPGQQPRK